MRLSEAEPLQLLRWKHGGGRSAIALGKITKPVNVKGSITRYQLGKYGQTWAFIVITNDDWYIDGYTGDPDEFVEWDEEAD